MTMEQFLFTSFCCIAFCAAGILLGMWMERTYNEDETDSEDFFAED